MWKGLINYELLSGFTSFILASVLSGVIPTALAKGRDNDHSWNQRFDVTILSALLTSFVYIAVVIGDYYYHPSSLYFLRTFGFGQLFGIAVGLVVDLLIRFFIVVTLVFLGGNLVDWALAKIERHLEGTN